MGQGARLDLRLYLEGIEVPVVAATVSSTPNSPAVASIQIIPTDTAFFMKPRTTVHLFFLDYLDKSSDELKRYKLLFAGEIVGFNFTKEIQMRTMVIQCLDHTNVWDITHQYFFNIGTDNAAMDGRLAQVGGQTRATFDDVLGPAPTLRKLIIEGAESNNLPRSFPGMTGLMGGVIHLIESLTGTASDGDVTGNAVNPFFMAYNLRNRVTDQIFAAKEDKSSTQLFQLSVFERLISRDLGQAGYRLSLRDILNTLLGYIYFSLVTITTPKYIRDAKAEIAPELKEEARVKRNILKFRIFLLEKARDEARDARSKNNGRNLPLQNFFDRRLIDPTIGHPVFLKKLQEIDDVGTETNMGVLEDIIAAQKTERDKVPQGDITPDGRRDRLNSFIFLPNIYFLPPPKCNVFFPELYDQFNFQRSMLDEPSRILVDTTHAIIDGGSPFLKAMKLRAIGPNSIPSISGTQENAADGLVGLDPDQQKVTLLPHEQFTGIIMNRRTFPDVAVYLSRAILDDQGRASGVPRGSTADLNVPFIRDAANFEFFLSRFRARSLNIAGRFNPFVALGFPALVIDKLRAVRAEVRGSESFSKGKAIANEGLEVTTVEGPESPTERTKVRAFTVDPDNQEGAFQSGVHFLGVVARIQHAVTQQGGNTFVDLANVHLHNELTGFEQEGDLATTSLEDFLFPPWFDEIYLPDQIGNFYQRAIGTRSIMLRDRPGVSFAGFADANASEIPQSREKAIADANEHTQLKQAEAEQLREEKDLRTEMSLRDLYGPLDEQIFERGKGTGIKIKNTSFLAGKDIVFNAKTDSVDVITRKLKFLSEGVRGVRGGLNTNRLSFDPEGRTEITGPAQIRFNKLVTDVEQTSIDAGKLADQVAFQKDFAQQAEEFKEEANKAADREKINPRDFRNDVRKSVEALVTEYARRVSAGGTVIDFVNAFVRREIATLPQTIGTPITPDSPGTDSEFAPEPGSSSASARGSLLRTGGFFSYAFGVKPIPEATAAVNALTADPTQITAQDVLDPRKERFAIILKYQREVTQGGSKLLSGAAIG